MRIIASLLATALLASCGAGRFTENFDTRPNAGPCPSQGAIYDVARYVKFADGDDQLYSNIEYTGEIIDVRTFCRYYEDDPLQAEIEIDFAFGKGELATSDVHSFPYFVAVTRRNGKVLAKEFFTASADFDGKRLTGVTELIGKIQIPRSDSSISGSNFEILVGFDLTEEQLQFNRDGRRFRLDAER